MVSSSRAGFAGCWAIALAHTASSTSEDDQKALRSGDIIG
jgi:hypothetical protein